MIMKNPKDWFPFCLYLDSSENARLSVRATKTTRNNVDGSEQLFKKMSKVMRLIHPWKAINSVSTAATAADRKISDYALDVCNELSFLCGLYHVIDVSNQFFQSNIDSRIVQLSND